MKKKMKMLALSFIAAGLLFVDCMSTKAAQYPDVNEGNWYYPYVMDVSDRGLMTGYENGMFGVTDKMTRGQFATILWRMSGSPDMGYSDFPDVPSSMFYSKACQWAKSSGVITGYSNGNFGGNDYINREQVATILYRYSKGEVNGNIWSFPDGSSVSEYARDGMSYAVGNGIIKGDNGYLNPKGNVVRAVAATMISRLNGEVSTPDNAGESKYSYEVKVLNNPNYGLYTEQMVILYIKTDNPDENSFSVMGENSPSQGTGGYFGDIHYLEKDNIIDICEPVDGGYITCVKLHKPGMNTIEIVEGNTLDQGKSVYSTSIEVKDFYAARDDWYTSVINEVTESTMTGQEKMSAVCNYVLNNFKYLPLDSDGMDLILVSHVGAFWDAKEITCWDSTDMMIEFANRFGYQAEGTYAGYLSHYYATVTIDGNQYVYDACPPDNNVITVWDYVL